VPADSTLALYLVATLLTCLAPGPNVLLCVSLGLRDGQAGVLRAIAGIVTASCLFLAVSALGIAAALQASSTLFAFVRYAGAAYLVWIGTGLLRAALRAPRGTGAARLAGDATAPAQVGDAAPVAARAAARGAYWQGLATHLSNPKAILFWTALLPQFIDPARAAGPQIVVLGVVGIALDAGVLYAYGRAAAATRHVAPTDRFTRGVDLVAGAFFVATGTLLAVAHLR
jgi:homoserine/homoserine lactone efflux protein